MTKIEFKLHNGLVAIKMGDAGDGTLDWKGARELSMDLKRHLKNNITNQVTYKFRMSGHDFYLVVEKAAAEQFQKAVYLMSLQAEELAKAEKIAFDTGILYRAGMPFGLSDHPGIKDLAANEAAWNRTLRRAMPSIPSGERVGLPTLKLENNHVG